MLRRRLWLRPKPNCHGEPLRVIDEARSESEFADVSMLTCLAEGCSSPRFLGDVAISVVHIHHGLGHPEAFRPQLGLHKLRHHLPHTHAIRSN